MCMLSVCLAMCVMFNGEISLLYNYTVIRYTRGVPEITETKLALEFIMKLDPKRYKRMLAQMRTTHYGRTPTLIRGLWRPHSGSRQDGPMKIQDQEAMESTTTARFLPMQLLCPRLNPGKGGESSRIQRKEDGRNNMLRMRRNWILCSRLREAQRSRESSGGNCHCR
jgi:hypothetical protein